MIKKISMANNYRAIFISDIHGNLDSLKALLSNVKYNQNQDYLFILGDMIEKGEKNLETLQYIISLTNNPRCYALIGNCDDYILCQGFNVIRYMLNRSNSILCQIAFEVGIDIHSEFDLDNFLKTINKNYQKEIEFVEKLPTIIESDDFILAHAGVYPNNDYINTDYKYATSHDNQGLVEYKYPKPLIVGHWPSSLYNKRFNVNPHLDYEKNIFSIDGANSIKKYGQLNALIFNKNNDKIIMTIASYDNLKSVKTKNTQIGTNGEKLIWPYNMLEIIEEDELFVWGYQQRYGERGYNIEDEYIAPYIKTPKAFIYEYQGSYYTHEYGNYFLDIPAGTEVRIVLDNNESFVIIKYNGEIGLIEKKNLEI